MKLKTKLTENEIVDIAKSFGFKISIERQGNFYILTLKHNTSVTKKEQYVRKGFKGQKINAVCLHGYTAFMTEIIKKDNQAFFKSSMYPSKIDIHNIKDVYETLHSKNIGSLFYPQFFGWACFCDASTIEQMENEIENLKEV